MDFSVEEQERVKEECLKIAPSIVKKNKLKEWADFVEVNTKDDYSYTIMRMVIDTMTMFVKHEDFEDIDRKIKSYSQSSLRNGVCVANAVRFGKNSDGFLAFYNNKNNIKITVPKEKGD
jgi:hypothetical protein